MRLNLGLLLDHFGRTGLAELVVLEMYPCPVMLVLSCDGEASLSMKLKQKNREKEKET